MKPTPATADAVELFLSVEHVDDESTSSETETTNSSAYLFFAELFNDLTIARAQLQADDTAFYRRTYARCFFTFVDAVVTELIDWLTHHVHAKSLTARDQRFAKFALRTQCYNTTRSSTVEFVLATYGIFRDRGLDCFSDPGWEDFKFSRKIRNVVTHPDMRDGLEIDDLSLSRLQKAEEWLFHTLAELEGADFERLPLYWEDTPFESGSSMFGS